MSATEEPIPDVLRRERRWVLVGVAVVASLLVAQVVAGVTRTAVTDEPTTLELVQRCLTERATPFGPSSDPVAASAGRGALRTTVDGNPVTVALGSSDADAERVYRAYVATAPADVVASRLELDRRVVFLWAAPPTQEQRDFMHLCTLDAQR